MAEVLTHRSGRIRYPSEVQDENETHSHDCSAADSRPSPDHGEPVAQLPLPERPITPTIGGATRVFTSEKVLRR